jgi:hypothetical protein
MFLLLLATMPKNILYKLPDDKVKLMIQKKCIFHINIGDRLAIYCLPETLMAMTCPCGYFNSCAQIHCDHLKKCCLLYSSFKLGSDYDNDNDNTLKNEEQLNDRIFPSISFKSYQELQSKPNTFTYGGKFIVYCHHTYEYICPCGYYCNNYYNFHNYHIKRKKDKCDYIINNYYQVNTVSSLLFEPDLLSNNDGTSQLLPQKKKSRLLTHHPPSNNRSNNTVVEEQQQQQQEEEEENICNKEEAKNIDEKDANDNTGADVDKGYESWTEGNWCLLLPTGSSSTPTTVKIRTEQQQH